MDKKYTEEEYYKYFSKMLRVDYVIDSQRPDKERKLKIYGDKETVDYLEEKTKEAINSIKSSKQKIEFKKNERNRIKKELERFKEGYEQAEDRMNKEEAKEAIEKLEKITELDNDIRIIENNLLLHSPTVGLKDGIEYALQNGKVGVIKLEYMERDKAGNSYVHKFSLGKIIVLESIEQRVNSIIDLKELGLVDPADIDVQCF